MLIPLLLFMGGNLFLTLLIRLHPGKVFTPTAPEPVCDRLHFSLDISKFDAPLMAMPVSPLLRVPESPGHAT